MVAALELVRLMFFVICYLLVPGHTTQDMALQVPKQAVLLRSKSGLGTNNEIDRSRIVRFPCSTGVFLRFARKNEASYETLFKWNSGAKRVQLRRLFAENARVGESDVQGYVRFLSRLWQP